MTKITGSLNAINEVKGGLTSDKSIAGKLGSVDKVTASLTPTTSLAGSLSSSKMEAKLTAIGSIKASCSFPEIILGDADPYDGEYLIYPSMEEQRLNTKGKVLKDDVLILEIPLFETQNESGGTTVYVATGG